MKEKLFIFLRDAGVRALRTMAQTALASMTVGATMEEVRWGHIASAAVVAGVYSLLMSLNNLSAGGTVPAALPEGGGGDGNG